jgi:hypothetical protein
MVDEIGAMAEFGDWKPRLFPRWRIDASPTYPEEDE